MHRDILNGTYLLRNSSNSDSSLTLSVRSAVGGSVCVCSGDHSAMYCMCRVGRCVEFMCVVFVCGVCQERVV